MGTRIAVAFVPSPEIFWEKGQNSGENIMGNIRGFGKALFGVKLLVSFFWGWLVSNNRGTDSVPLTHHPLLLHHHPLKKNPKK